MFIELGGKSMMLDWQAKIISDKVNKLWMEEKRARFKKNDL